jgi:hypothetical protein
MLSAAVQKRKKMPIICRYNRADFSFSIPIPILTDPNTIPESVDFSELISDFI